jgi:2-polyprenyl-3-methyl-5-hydroxy-6-metoxy-1,4-benzoquinol methylase
MLDNPEIPRAGLWRNLTELETINRLLGGHRATLLGLEKIAPHIQGTMRIVDLGCGGGDTLRAIWHWASARGIQVELTGIDLLPDAIAYAKVHSMGYPIAYQTLDFESLPTGQYNVAMSSLVGHHLYGEKLKSLFNTKLRIASYAILNDLHRHWFAYFSIKWLTRLLSRSYLVRHDACLSVAKAFTKKELHQLIREIPAHSKTITWIWAFRWLVVIQKDCGQ